ENSGTAMRLFAGLLAGRPFLSVLSGDDSLRGRPMGRVVEPLRAMGARVDGRDGATRAPLVVRGGALRALRYELPVASAQVKTAVVLAGLQAEGETEVVSPGPSRDHTERMLVALGAPVTVDGLSVRVAPGAPASFALDVPGDPSSAAFFAVAAAITPGSDIVIESVSCNPTRVGFVAVLERMGADIELTTSGEVCGEPVGELRVRASALRATTISGDEIPNVIDEIPALAVAAAFAEGVTDIRDAAELAVKESNRIGTLHEELGKLGVGVEARADGLVVRGGRAEAGDFDSHGDHRIAMAMAIAANALIADSTVNGWRSVASSYPEFGGHLARLTGSDAR
ncbi:MAG TPA: 3-phosphoshikimate 1-carboxyvinyltransferase, partial [Acidimicrobiia bacterium]